MNEGKRLVKNTLIIAVAGISTKLIAFLLLPLYTATLSTSEYGDFDYITILSLFFIPIITLLMDESMFRFLIDCKTTSEKKKVFTIACAIEIVGILVFSGLAIVVLSFLKYQYSTSFILYVVACSLCYIINPLLRGQGKYKLYALYNVMISLLVSILSVFALLFLHKGIYGLLAACIVSHTAAAIIMSVHVKIWRYIDVKEFKWKEAIHMIKYSLPLIPNKLSWLIIGISDRLVIMNFMGSSFAGIYAISNKFPMIMDTIYSFFSMSWQESASRVLRSEESDIFYNQMYKYVQRLVLSANCLLCAFMPIIFHILIDSAYNDALKYVPILLLATTFGEVGAFYGGVFFAYKDTRVIGKSTVIAATAKIVLVVGMVSWLGLYAGAASTVIANMIICVYRRIKIAKYTRLEEEVRVIVVSFLFLGVIWYCFFCQLIAVKVLGGIAATMYAIILNKELIKKMYTWVL